MHLSIIIPTIGRETLEDVLEGIRQCTDYEAIAPEVLVVWDGEKRSRQYEVGSRGEKEVHLETGEKVYAGGARNVGIEAATGDVIIFMSDDTIPKPDWLSKVYKFHVLHPKKEAALLGKISWTPELARDPFHQWLENHGQFAFKNIEEGSRQLAVREDAFRFFYTSNVSVKRELIGEERFELSFTGWGFEDGEFGYRLQKKGMQLHYDPSWEVLHDHHLTLDTFLQNTRNAKRNALHFESLHPELQIRPRGGTRRLLAIGCWLLAPFTFFNKKLSWWVQWKRNWI